MSLQRRARDLIATAGDGDGPTAAERARLRARVLARVGAAAAVGTAGVALSVKAAPAVAAVAEAGVGGAVSVAKSSLGALVAKLLSVVMIVGLGATGYAVLSGAGRDVRAPATVAPLPPAAAPVQSLAQARPIPQLPPAPPEAVDEARAGARTEPGGAAQVANGATSAREAHATTIPPHAAPGAPPTRVEPATAESVEAETASLAAVLASLRDGHPEEALSALDAQDSRYADGALGEERAATRIDALCMQHRTDAARAAVSRFREAHPRSLLAPRVGASCGALPAP